MFLINHKNIFDIIDIFNKKSPKFMRLVYVLNDVYKLYNITLYNTKLINIIPKIYTKYNTTDMINFFTNIFNATETKQIKDNIIDKSSNPENDEFVLRYKNLIKFDVEDKRFVSMYKHSILENIFNIKIKNIDQFQKVIKIIMDELNKKI
jgi:hypothetical protein